MPLPLKDVLNLIVKFDEQYGIPFPSSKEFIYKWAESLNIPRDKKVALYTGALYQLTPHMKALTKYLEMLEKTEQAAPLLKLGGMFGDVVGKMLIKVPEEEINKQYEILRNIVEVLREANVDFGYLYENDGYSGALLYDLGLDDAFAAHARKEYNRLKSAGVDTLITIDPHTTYIMREVYKKYVKDFDLKVVNYLELLAKSNVKPKNVIADEIVIHDPCYYSRYLGIVEEPRTLLKNGGLKIMEPQKTKSLTNCCGAPIESVAPELSKSVAKMRMDELVSAGKKIVVMCPMCYLSLSKVKPDGVELIDISSYLKKIYGD